MARRGHGFFGCRDGFLRSVLDGLPQLPRILRQRMPPLQDRRQVRVHALYRQSFALHAGDAGLRAALSDVGQPFAIAKDLVQVAHGAAVRTAAIGQLGPVGHAVLDFFLDCARIVTQKDGVPVRLGHLAFVCTQKLGRWRQKRLGLRKNRFALQAIEAIEPPCHFPC